jgi:4-amino-4-deoxy-L-arabinose transferase-like glycosyltransferase
MIFNTKLSALSKQKLYFILGGLLLLAGLFRLPKLNTLPDGFFPDEAALAYNGWSLWQTGRDEWGKQLPLTLRSFDDNKPAVYAYLTIPFVLKDGLTHAAARYPSALAGSILPLLVFLLAYKQKKGWVGLLAALVIIISPWHWEVSRTAIEAGVALTFSLAVLIFITLKKSWSFWAVILFSGLTIFTYHTARLMLPGLLILGAMFLQLPKTNFNKKKVALFGGLLFVIGMALSFTASSNRFKQISIFTDRGGLALRLESIREDGVAQAPLFLTRVFHNKLVTWSRLFTKSYLSQTSLEFLFWGGVEPNRVRIPEMGQFLLIFLPFFILGLVKTVRRFDDFDKFSLFWFLAAPIPASLTSAEIPHAYRTLFMLVPIAFITAQGLLIFVEFTKSNLPKLATVLLTLSLMVAVIGNTAYAWHQYVIHQQLNKPWYRQYGYQELFTFLRSLPENRARKIIITQTEKEPYIYALYYNQVPPRVYQAQPEKRLSHKAIEQGKTFWNLFNYTFVEEPCPYDYGDKNPHDLYVANKSCELAPGFRRVCRVVFQDQSTMFFVDQPQGEVGDNILLTINEQKDNIIPVCGDLSSKLKNISSTTR